jgi:peroxiredoxin
MLSPAIAAWVLLAALRLCAQAPAASTATAASTAPAAFPLVKSCAAGADTVATLRGADSVKVRYSFLGDAGTCYAVTATVDGKGVDGYLIGNAHPAIAAFEQDVQLHAAAIPVPPPPPPPAPPSSTVAAKPAAASPAPAPVAKAEPPAAPAPLSFAGFRAIAINGDRVDLSKQRAANVVIYFWSARSARAIQSIAAINALYDIYHTRGVDMVGIASAASSSKLDEVSRDHEFIWPQVLDSGGIAARYHVDPANPFLVLDQSRNVIAAVPAATALGPILEQLTKNRRPR